MKLFDEIEYTNKPNGAMILPKQEKNLKNPEDPGTMHVWMCAYAIEAASSVATAHEATHCESNASARVCLLHNENVV